MQHGTLLVSRAYPIAPAESQRIHPPIFTQTSAIMDDYHDKRFIRALRVIPEERSLQDLELIFGSLRGMEALCWLREPALRSLCKTVRYERHTANDILYCRGELATCWYILLSGSVFIDGSMYLPRSR
ncbi:rap guanine nucleotide exchange factor 6-like [Macrobrachium rosenbergii]|uniref:rap guanine nucleotide exchange factor 6-like n=1 Tax=Macrobrachium rosenbergii TaxID=79674 RepID=UPI0034D3E067